MAGRFYPESINSIEDAILKAKETTLSPKKIDRTFLGGISPHAGYMFSLKHMIPLFELLNAQRQQDQPIVIINPNHSGRGASLSIDSHDHWETPMGKAEIDSLLCREILHHKKHLAIIREPMAQEREHAAEVLLPLLSYYLKSFTFLPLSMGTVSVDIAQELALNFYHIKKRKGINPIILASSDFNHFSSPEEGRILDDLALEPLMNFDSRGFYKIIKEKKISICGYGPIMVLLEYAKLVSTNPAITLLSRGHSGESDYYGKNKPEEVVDYISFAVYK